MTVGDRVTATPGVSGTVTRVLDRQRVTVAWDDGWTTDIRNDQVTPEVPAGVWVVYYWDDGPRALSIHRTEETAREALRVSDWSFSGDVAHIPFDADFADTARYR